MLKSKIRPSLRFLLSPFLPCLSACPNLCVSFLVFFSFFQVFFPQWQILCEERHWLSFICCWLSSWWPSSPLRSWWLHCSLQYAEFDHNSTAPLISSSSPCRYVCRRRNCERGMVLGWWYAVSCKFANQNNIHSFYFRVAFGLFLLAVESNEKSEFGNGKEKEIETRQMKRIDLWNWGYSSFVLLLSLLRHSNWL